MGQYVVSGSRDHTARIWDVKSGDCIKTLEGHTKDVRDVSFSPNNQYVVSGSDDETVRIWKINLIDLCVYVPTTIRSNKYSSNSNPITAVASSFCGKFVACGSNNNVHLI